jgi:hypothetical protein
MQYRFLGDTPGVTWQTKPGDVSTQYIPPAPAPTSFCQAGETLVDVGGDFPICMSGQQATAFGQSQAQIAGGSSGLDLTGIFSGLTPTALVLIVGLAALLFLKK